MALPPVGTRLSAYLDRAALEHAYVCTTYVAWLPAGEISIRVGQACPQLDAFLPAHGCQSWAFVSAFNPRSQVLCEQENLSRHENLLRAVAAQKLEYYAGEGRGDDGGWPAEKGLLIIGIAAEQAAQLCRQFDQNAVVIGQAGGQAQLLWCMQP